MEFLPSIYRVLLTRPCHRSLYLRSIVRYSCVVELETYSKILQSPGVVVDSGSAWVNSNRHDNNNPVYQDVTQIIIINP